jgi:hypothetical protein
MFSIYESKLRMPFKISTNFNFHFEAILLNIDYYSDNFPIIYIDNVVIFQISLDCLIIDSDVIRFWGLPELATRDCSDW